MGKSRKDSPASSPGGSSAAVIPKSGCGVLHVVVMEGTRLVPYSDIKLGKDQTYNPTVVVGLVDDKKDVRVPPLKKLDVRQLAVWNSQVDVKVKRLDSQLRLSVFDASNKFGLKGHLGSVTLSVFPDFDQGVEIDMWYKLKRKDAKVKELVEGEIRLRIRFSCVSPVIHASIKRQFMSYDDLCKTMMEGDLVVVRALIELYGDRPEKVAERIVRIFVANGDADRIGIWMIQTEIADLKDASFLFRSDSVLSRMIQVFLRLVGEPFLRAIVAPIIRDVLIDSGNYEISPQFIGADEKLSTNIHNLSRLSQKFFDCIVDSLTAEENAMPRPLLLFAQAVHSQVEKRFPGLGKAAVAGYLFQRFICPAIMAPELNGLCGASPDKTQRRVLILVGKVLQNLGNQVDFGAKEQYMKVMNKFLLRNSKRMDEFLGSIVSISPRKSHESLMVHLVRRKTLIEDAGVLQEMLAIHFDLIGSNLFRDESVLQECPRILLLNSSGDAGWQRLNPRNPHFITLSELKALKATQRAPEGDKKRVLVPTLPASMLKSQSEEPIAAVEPRPASAVPQETTARVLKNPSSRDLLGRGFEDLEAYTLERHTETKRPRFVKTRTIAEQLEEELREDLAVARETLKVREAREAERRAEMNRRAEERLASSALSISPPPGAKPPAEKVERTLTAGQEGELSQMALEVSTMEIGEESPSDDEDSILEVQRRLAREREAATQAEAEREKGRLREAARAELAELRKAQEVERAKLAASMNEEQEKEARRREELRRLAEEKAAESDRLESEREALEMAKAKEREELEAIRRKPRNPMSPVVPSPPTPKASASFLSGFFDTKLAQYEQTRRISEIEELASAPPDLPLPPLPAEPEPVSAGADGAAGRSATEEPDRLAKEEAQRLAKEEAERLAKEEAERLAKEEADRLAKEEADRLAKEEADRLAKEEAEKLAKQEAERLAKEEAERLVKEEAERLAKEEAERLAKEEAERLAKEEADRLAKEEADRLAKEEAERLAKEEAERLAKEEAERLAKQEAERLAKQEAERLAKEEAERLAKQEAECLAKEEAERLAKQEAERLAKEEAERLAKQEAERLAKQEAERLAKEEAERLAKEEAERLAKDEAERLAKEEAERLAEEEAERLAKEESERLAKQEAERLAKEEAERLAKQEAERLAKQEAERLAKQEAERLAKEEAERLAKEEAERLAKEEAERLAKEEAERLAKEEAERLAKEEAERLAKEEAERLAKQEAERLAKEEAERLAKEEAERLAKEEAERLAREEAERLAKEEAARLAKEEAERLAEEERLAKEEAERLAKQEAGRLAEEEAGRLAKEEAERLAKEEAERLAKEEAGRLAKQEAERLAKEEAERLAKEEADRLKEEVERLANEEAERLAREEAERRAKEEAERLAKEEAERLGKEEAERLTKEEAEQLGKEEAERLGKDEAERLTKEEAERLAKEETERPAKEDAERLAKEEAERLAKGEAEQLPEEEAERLAKEETDQVRKEEAKRLAGEEDERLAKDEAKRLAKKGADQLSDEVAGRLAKDPEVVGVRESSEDKIALPIASMKAMRAEVEKLETPPTSPPLSASPVSLETSVLDLASPRAAAELPVLPLTAKVQQGDQEVSPRVGSQMRARKRRVQLVVRSASGNMVAREANVLDRARNIELARRAEEEEARLASASEASGDAAHEEEKSLEGEARGGAGVPPSGSVAAVPAEIPADVPKLPETTSVGDERSPRTEEETTSVGDERSPRNEEETTAVSDERSPRNEEETTAVSDERSLRTEEDSGATAVQKAASEARRATRMPLRRTKSSDGGSRSGGSWAQREPLLGRGKPKISDVLEDEGSWHRVSADVLKEAARVHVHELNKEQLDDSREAITQKFLLMERRKKQREMEELRAVKQARISREFKRSATRGALRRLEKFVKPEGERELMEAAEAQMEKVAKLRPNVKAKARKFETVGEADDVVHDAVVSPVVHAHADVVERLLEGKETA